MSPEQPGRRPSADDAHEAEELALRQQCEANPDLAAECLADARTDALLQQLAVDGAVITRSLRHHLAAEQDAGVVVDGVRARLQAETVTATSTSRPWTVLLVAAAAMLALVWIGVRLGTGPAPVQVQTLAQAPLREDGRLLRPYSVPDGQLLVGLQHTVAIGDDWRPVVLLDWNDTAGAASYRVYRQAAAGSQAWLRVADQLPSSDFHDPDTLPGQVYRYYVTAVDAAGRESERSALSSCETPTQPRGEQRLDLLPRPAWSCQLLSAIGLCPPVHVWCR